MKIAVVGAGISGLSAAWLLSKRHEVVLFERNAHVGGHSDTAEVVEAERRTVPVDTGFIVYNEQAYPNLVALFDLLGVDTSATEMSFSVSLGDGAYEYSGNGAAGLFAQRRNLLSPTHWFMVRDIVRFFGEVSELDAGSIDPNLSIGEGGSNHIKLVCEGDLGILYVNDTLVAEMDLSARGNSGDVIITTGVLVGNQIIGYETEYHSFTVWALP